MLYLGMPDFLKSGNDHILLLNGKWGLEKESLRVTPDGRLALTPHPEAFGDKIGNTEITTDFSESQVEMITPPEDSGYRAYQYLLDLQNRVELEIGGEYLWPFSMPPLLPEEKDIPIARFNGSKTGRSFEKYREGLAERYGKKMQMISGIHYNFSLDDSFWDFLYEREKPGCSRAAFKNENYLRLARNYLRYRWLIVYLFGASPVIDESFAAGRDEYHEIDKFRDTAVSIRMSPFGYSPGRQKKLKVSFESLGSYISGVEYAINTDFSEDIKTGLCDTGKSKQLNSRILQNESEFYSPIRLKSGAKKGESHLEKLKTEGIRYIEIRSVDLNPFQKAGLSPEQLHFYHIFMLYCLFGESTPLSEEETELIEKNDELTSLSGRKPGIGLYRPGGKAVKLTDWALELILQMIPLAEVLDRGYSSGKYMKSLVSQVMKTGNPALLPSSMIVSEMDRQNLTFIEYGMSKINRVPVKSRRSGGREYGRRYWKICCPA